MPCPTFTPPGWEVQVCDKKSMHPRDEGDPNGGTTRRASFTSAASPIVDGMDNRAEVREFLTSRRARVTPAQVGLPNGRNRRVAGLRRSEVATLAGRQCGVLHAGSSRAPSAAHPWRSSTASPRRCSSTTPNGPTCLISPTLPARWHRPPRRQDPQTWRPHESLQWLLDGITVGPAFVRNGRLDLLAGNRLARAFYKDAYDMAGHPNLARFTFLDQRSRSLHTEWESAADVVVSILRTETGRDPQDEELQSLVSELCTRSDDFLRLWNAHNVRHHGTGYKRFRHPVVGELTIAYEGLE